MKKSVVLLFSILIVFSLTSCISKVFSESVRDDDFIDHTSKLIVSDEFRAQSIKPLILKASLENSEVLEISSTSAFPTRIPKFIPTPTFVWDFQRAKIRSVMQHYGFVEEYYLTDEYWNTLYNRIEKFGVARRIVALEYHGNDYNMYDGSYSLNPNAFYKQIEYLMGNQYHFVTIHELKGFLDGWLDLPEKSIILTTDSGYTSQESFASMITQFSELELIYGYKPHMQSYVWTKGMTQEESSVCKENACWEIILRAKGSGFFTFGTHSETHPEFENMSVDFLKKDLGISVKKILENTGLNVYAITWPHESCSWNLGALREIGIEIGFGGLSKIISEAYVYKNDEMYNCLPRLFPPNGAGYSSRPLGYTLEDMLNDAQGR